MKDVEVLRYLALFSRKVRKMLRAITFLRNQTQDLLVENKLEFKNPIELKTISRNQDIIKTSGSASNTLVHHL